MAASWLWGASNAGAFDAGLLELTSETLPTPSLADGLETDVEKALDLSDLVRSGQVKPADALRAFKKRLTATTNPNVQLRTLLVLDTAIKNSGDAFLRELSTDKALVEDIADLICHTTNHDLKQAAMQLYQNWALAFRSKSHLSISDLVLTYGRLERQGIVFPPVASQTASAMIDSLAAPSWISNEDSNLCSRCRDPFTITNRRHHCRNCGQLFDQKCSSNSLALPHFGITQPVRVCDGCFKKIKSGRRHTMDPIGSPKVSHTRSVSFRESTSQEDDDLALALRLSLEETRQAGRAPTQPSGYRPSYAPPAEQPRVDSKRQEEEDPDLAAAIAASLRDMELAPSAPPELGPSVPAGAPSTETQSSFPLPMDKELPAADLDALLTFSQSSIQARAQPGSTTVNDLAPLYENAERSRRRLVDSVKDAAGKEQVLLSTKDKLKEIMRLYESVLEKQVARHSVPSAHYRYEPQPQQHQQPVYGGPGYAPAAQPQYLYPSASYAPPHAEPAQAQGIYPSAPAQSPSLEQPAYNAPPTQPEAPAWESQPPVLQYQQIPAPLAQYYSYAPGNPNPETQASAPPISSPPLAPVAEAPPLSPVSPTILPSAYPGASSPPQQAAAQFQQPVYEQPNHHAQPSYEQTYQPPQSFHEPANTQAPAQAHQPLQRRASVKAAQARQLQDLPHAPQHALYSFPSVPDLDLPVSAEQQRQPEMLIEL